MTKNNDSQDVEKDKKNRNGARRRPNGGKSFIAQFQWDSVDDQAQEDLVVPTSPRRKSAKPSRRRDKDVGTMYVVPTDEVYARPKKKARPEPRLEEIADFVADIDDGEEDGFATPSYGRTKLTRNDEELVEELATKKEKVAARSKNAPKSDETSVDGPETARRPKADKPERRDADAKKSEPKPERRGREERSTAPRETAPKHSFLSKIKEAISTGSISRERAESSESDADGSDAKISSNKMRRLTQNAKKILDATGVSSEKLDAPKNAERSQLDELTDLLEALIQANLTLIQTTRSTGAATAKPEPTATPETTTEPEATAEPEFSAPKNRERRPARTVEEIFNDAAPRRAPQKPARPIREEREERVETSAPTEKIDEKSAPRSWGAIDDDFDPIARWESIAEEDEEETTETAAFPASAERGPKSTFSSDDFDDWNDEVAAKKKSGRNGQKPEKEPALEAAPLELAAAEPDLELEPEQEPSESAEPSDEADERPTKPFARSAKKSRAPRRSGRAEKIAKRAESAEIDADEDAEDVDAPDESTRPLEKFGDLTLTEPTLKALSAMGYVSPTPIQTGTIPRIQAGVDLMGQAQTGTGKTAAFMIPIVEGVAACEPSRDPLALAVVPTRELAVQVRDETQRLAQFRDMNIVACYGGKPIASQVEKIRRGVDILVGTPGRIIDLTNRGALSLSSARWVVLDEADRMLDVGFRPDVEKILRKTSDSRQTLLFSATLAPPVVRLAKTYMKNPEQYDFSQRDVAADTIEQFYVTVDQDRKFDALVRLLETQEFHQAIVFCRTKRHVDTLGRRLESRFKNVEAIHGDLPQSKRDHIMANFRAEKTKILVATDVVGRGIDVSTVSHIINFDVPQYCDDYVHRVGRAGRMGREGVAFTLVTTEEGAELTRIEIRINRLLKRMELPGFEAYSKPVEGPGASAEPDRFERKPVFGKATRRVRRAL